MPIDLTFGIAPAIIEGRNREAQAARSAADRERLAQWQNAAGNARASGLTHGLEAIGGGFGNARGALEAAGRAAFGYPGGGGMPVGGGGGMAVGTGMEGGGGGGYQPGGSLGAGYEEAQGALGQGRRDMLGAYAGGQEAIAGGLRGGLGMLGAGAAGAQAQLNPYINQDLAARGAYQQRLMGGLAGGDDPYWNRLAGQRTDSIEASLAKQGMLGSSAGGQALADSGAQLQNMREQQFFDRAQGLFNAGAAQQAAGLSQQAGMAGSDIYGRAGQQSAGLFGQQAEGLGGLGRTSAGLFQERGRDIANAQLGLGQALAGTYTGEAGATTGLWGNYGSGRANDIMGGAALEFGQPYPMPTSTSRFTDPGDVAAGAAMYAAGRRLGGG